MEYRSLKGASAGVGAEVHGIDLRRSITHDVARELRALVARFQILIFRGQGLSPSEQLQFTRAFGALEPSIARRPKGHQVPECPEVLYLSNEPGSPTNDYGAGWHSDGLAYARVPHGVTILTCVACPPGAGATLFANQYAAYQSMSESLRQEIDGLQWYLPHIPFSEIPAGKGLAQPMIRIHPETGRKFLFCSPSTRQLRGWSCGASADILRTVRSHQVRDDCVYRHEWAPSDVVVWENCALLHNRADIVDFATQGLRAMHRSATCGTFEAVECEPADIANTPDAHT